MTQRNIRLIKVLVFLISMSIFLTHCEMIAAKPILESEIATVVSNWLRDKSEHFGENMGNEIEQIKFYDNGNEIGYYLVILRSNGWIVLPDDDSLWPIQLFSDGHMTSDRFEKSFWYKYILRGDKSERRTLTQSLDDSNINDVDLRKNRRAWNKFLRKDLQKQGRMLPSVNPLPGNAFIIVEPFMKGQMYWGQRDPFNMHTNLNKLSNYTYSNNQIGVHSEYPVGCVALSYGQVMHYILTNNYPQHTAENLTTRDLGPYHYIISDDSGYIPGRLNFSSLISNKYNWNGMSNVTADSLNNIMANKEIISNDLSVLLRDLGVALGSDYNYIITNAPISSDVFRNFGFDYSTSIVSGTDVPLPYEHIVNSNLDLGFPIIVGVFKRDNTNNFIPSSGHAVPVDGYALLPNGTSFYHVLTGMSEIDNGAWEKDEGVWSEILASQIFKRIGVGGDTSYVFGIAFNIFPNIEDLSVDKRGYTLPTNPEIISGQAKKKIKAYFNLFGTKLIPSGDITIVLSGDNQIRRTQTNDNGIYSFIVDGGKHYDLYVEDNILYLPNSCDIGISKSIDKFNFKIQSIDKYVGNRSGLNFDPVDDVIKTGLHEDPNDFLESKSIERNENDKDITLFSFKNFSHEELSNSGLGDLNAIYVASDPDYDVNNPDTSEYSDAVVNAKSFVEDGGSVIATGKSSAFPALIGNQPIFYQFNDNFVIYSQTPFKVIRMASQYMKDIFGNVEFQFTSSLPQSEHSLIQLAGNSTIHAIALYALRIYTPSWGWETIPEYAPTAIEYNHGTNGGKVIYSNLELSPNYNLGIVNREQFVDALIDPAVFRDNDEAETAEAVASYYDLTNIGGHLNYKQMNLDMVVYRQGITLSNAVLNTDMSFVFTIGSRKVNSIAPEIDSSGDPDLIVSLYKPSGELYATRRAVPGDNVVSIGVPAEDNDTAGNWKYVVEEVHGFNGKRVVVFAAMEGLYNIDIETIGDPNTIYDVIVRGSAKAPIASYPRGIAGDTFHHELGDRQSVIEPGTVSRISFGGLIRSDDVKVWRIDDDLVLAVSGTTDRVTVLGWFGARRGEDKASVTQVSFYDGTTLGVNDITSRAEAREPDKHIIIVSADRYLEGTSNGDTLTGDKGSNDTFLSKAGNDTMTGNGGINVYYYSRGWGDDTIIDNKESGDYGILRFDTDITPDDVTVSRSGGDMKFFADNGSVTVKGWFNNDRAKIDNAQFFDGTVWDARDAEKLANGEPLSIRETVLDAPGYPEPEYGDTSFDNSNDTDDFGVSEFGGGFGGSGGCNAGLMTFVMLGVTAAAYGILRGKNR